jgi:hypothetical protein
MNNNSDSISSSDLSSDISSASSASSAPSTNIDVNNIAEKKKQLVEKLSKEDMAELIFRQNNLLTKQSSQMLEIIDMANQLEVNIRSQGIDTNANKICDIQKQKLAVYENSIKIQTVLFILFIIILVWLFYNYSTIPNLLQDMFNKS